MLNLPTYVLRYWETEFPDLKPEKTAAGQRIYSEKDIDLLKRIIHLRYEEKLTLSGTKAKLLKQRGGVKSRVAPDVLNDIKKGLHEILTILQ